MHTHTHTVYEIVCPLITGNRFLPIYNNRILCLLLCAVNIYQGDYSVAASYNNYILYIYIILMYVYLSEGRPCINPIQPTAPPERRCK